MLYLQVSDEKSVRIDMTPSVDPGVVIPRGFKGILFASELLGEYSSSDAEATRRVVKRVTLRPRPGLSVQKVVEALEGNHFHQYHFDHSGTGCRYWITKAVHLLEKEHLVQDPSECDAAREALLLVWENDGSKSIRGSSLDRGQFHVECS